MSKFKVGDKVRVKKDLKINENYNTYTYTDGMHYGYGAKILTIDAIDSLLGNHYHMKEDGHHFDWTDDMLELVAPKSFTKSDLKDGMVVEFRDNPSCPRQIVVGDLFIGLHEHEYVRKCDYDDDLVCRIKDIKDKDLTIDKVYIIHTDAAKDENKYPFIKMDLIWERKEEPKHKEMTVEEIEKELGYKIKVVGDSSCQK